MKKKMIVKLFACAMVMTALTFGAACGTEAEDASSKAQIEATKIVSENEDGTAAQKEVGNQGGEESGKPASPSGTYARIYTEEFAGEEVSSEIYYAFRDDHTGEVSIQDVVEFTWDENKITYEDHDQEYMLEGDMLKVKENGEDWVEYVKK